MKQSDQMGKTRNFRSFLLWTAACAAAIPGTAFAQDAEEGVDDNVIIVTAQKREQDVQDVPISMSVVSGDTLTDLGVKDFTELDRFVPNLYVQTSPGNNAFYIRGIGSPPGTLNFEQTVGLFVDGIYGGHARQFQAPFLDVERIEVLRGPQGALVGKNTSAGAISIVSAKPTRDFQARLEGTYEWRLGGATMFGVVSGPISDIVSARLAAQYQDSDGFVTNSTLGGKEAKTKSLFGRASVLIDPDNGFSLLLKAEGGKNDIDGNALLRNDRPFTDLIRDTGGMPGYVARDFDYTDTLNAAATATAELGEHVLTAITGYSSYDYQKRLDSDFRALNSFGSGFGEDFSQFSQEVRLASPAESAFEYIVGIYGHINDYDLYQATRTATNLSERIFRQENKAWSAYASLTYKFTEALRLNGSLRYTADHKTADQQVQNVAPTTGVITPVRTLVGDSTEKQWDPSVSLQYDFTPDAMVYVSWGKGSKAGGFVGGAPATLQSQFHVNPERSETWEGGIKIAMFDRRLRWNAALYRTTFKNLQVSSYVSGSAPPQFVTQNAGAAKSQGIETDMRFEIADGISLNGSMAYLDAKFTDFLGANCLWDNPTCVVATNNNAGARLPRSPKWSGTLNLDIILPVSESLEFIANGGVTFRSFAFLEDSLRPAAGQPAYEKYDLRVGVRSSDRGWELALVGKNLTNELTAAHAFGTPGVAVATPGGISKFFNQPRTLAVQAKLSF